MFSDAVYSFTDSWFGTFVNSGVHLEDHNGHGPQVNMGKEELNIQLLLIQLVPQKKSYRGSIVAKGLKRVPKKGRVEHSTGPQHTNSQIARNTDVRMVRQRGSG